MKRLVSIQISGVMVLGFALSGALSYSQSNFQSNPQPNAAMSSGSPTAKPAMQHAAGAFDVKIIPQPAEDAGGAGIGRMLFDKQFHGDLEATSKGQMLASGTGAAGSSGAYVALEVVTGTLGRRKGTFVLQHSATMDRGVPSLSVTVVPGSGTGELVGLTGKMDIVIANGKHSYVFDYTLPE